MAKPSAGVRCKQMAKLLALLAIGSYTSCQSPPSEDEELYRIINTTWERRNLSFPLDTAAPGNDSRLMEMNPEAIRSREEFWQQTVDALHGIDRDQLADVQQVDLDIFQYIAQNELDQFKYQAHLMPFNAEGGFHTGFGMRSSRNLNSKWAAVSYIEQLNEFSRLVDQQIALMDQALEQGYTMPCAIVEGFDQTAETYIAEHAQASLFYRPLVSLPDRLDQNVRDSLQEAAKVAIETSVTPGYKRLAEYLATIYVPNCRSSLAAHDLPDGPAFYEQRIRYFTTLDMTAQQVYDLGTSEVARIKALMEEIIDDLNFDGSFEEFLQFLRTDEQFYAKTPGELMREASFISKKIDGKLPQYFGFLPRLTYGVEPVPDQIAPRYTGGRYVPGSAQNHRSGTYWVNTYKLESRPLYILPALTLHEAVPGHHFQISIAEEKEDLHDFRNDYYISAYGEGWALYTEWLGNEMGMYITPYEQFGALTYEMWRACRLVVDPGIHAFGWSRDEAVAFMAENTALSWHEINTEVNRYIGWPGQAVSYKIGELKIRELRKRAEDMLGNNFNLREFHDKVLENGSVPLFILEAYIDKWLKESAQQNGKTI